jgi:pyrophosphatase PpaX
MKAVVFDLDGTLLDVREGFFWQFQELTRLYDGAPVSKHMISAAAHGTTEQIVRTLVRNTQVPFDDICKQHQVLRLEAYKRHLKLYEGVDELLPILRNMGVKVAALTSGNGLTVTSLRQTGIHDHFDAIITAEHISNPKPHPEGLELVLKELELRPEDVVMVGDTVVDILVGRNAGVHKTIGVSHGFGNVPALQAAGADHIIHNIPSLLDVLE